MAKLPETPRYEAGIYQIEKTDLVVGGRDGLSNRQATQLGNRTAWLKQKVDQLSGRWSSALSALGAHKADTTAHPPRATTAQALAGQDNAGYMTALRVKEVMDAQASYSPTAVVHADNVSVGRVNDYRSGSSAGADILQLARSSDFDLTGIAGGTDGKELRVQCTGGGDLTLVHNSPHSASANRIWLSPSAYPDGEVKLQQGDTATLLYMSYNASVGAVWVLVAVTPTKATPAQAEAGTDDSGYVTSKAVAAAIAKQGWRPTDRQKQINVKKATKTLNIDMTDLDVVYITPEADITITLVGGYHGQRVVVVHSMPPWINKGVPIISEILVDLGRNVRAGDPVPPSGNYPTTRKRLVANEYSEFVRIGGRWRPLGDSAPSVPVGTIIRYPTNKPPFGWFYCDGSQVYNVMYRELANAMGLPHGGVQYRPLTIPDLRKQGHFIIKY